LNKVFTASDFIYDLKKNIFKSKHSLQLFITEFDFLALSNELLELLSKEISIDIIISSISEKKSLRLVNLFNRIVQSGGSIFWYKNSELYQNEVHFMISDKTFIINKSNHYVGESNEEKIKHLNSLFNNFRIDSKEIKLLTGDISIKLNAEKTFVEKNKHVRISWEVENAHRVSLENINDNLNSNGEMQILIKEDTIIKLEAENREKKISKKLIIKVLKSSKIEITVEAFDNSLEEYLVLKSAGVQKEQFYAFRGQQIKLSWTIDNMGNFSESILGKLPLEGEHTFFLVNKSLYEFTFDSIYGTKKNRIVIIPVDEELENEEIKIKEKKTLFGLAKVFSRFKKKKE
tara:strand:+ start:2635 stop:3672 length:1038 start_codon:yes stop_codon:yes gene_type:complete